MPEIKSSYRIAIIVFLIIAGFTILYLPKDNDDGRDTRKSVIAIGQPAPDFSYPDLSGRTIRLSDYRGSVVLVNIWATWCPPCIAEVASMEALYIKLKDENFQILAVSIDQQGHRVVAPFMKKYGLTYPALLDPEGTISVPYRATGVPESFIIDKEGLLIKKIIGPIDWKSPDVIRFFRELIQQS